MNSYRPDDSFYAPYSNARIQRYLDIKEAVLSEPLFECPKLQKEL